MADEQENFFANMAAPPPSALGRYRALSKHASLHVSPISLGAMSIGNEWQKIGVNGLDEAESFKYLDAYFDAGGNSIDNANFYQNEQSEIIVGKWMEARGIRDQIVVSSKYSSHHRKHDTSIKQHPLYLGNSAKSLRASLNDTLKKLRTDYVDIFYVHWWDYETSVEEVMSHLHNFVVAGKILYLGASNMPAWVVAQANTWAIANGKTPFAIYTGSWNVLDRSFEYDILPMAKSFGMAIAPYNVLGGGKLRSDEEEAKREQSGEKGRDTMGAGWKRTEAEVKMSHVLEKLAKEVGAKSLNAVAIAYLFHKAPYVFPIVGGRKVEHLKANIEAIEISLTPAQIAEIEGASTFSPPFPHGMLGDGTKNIIFYDLATTIDRLPQIPAITVPRSKN